MAAFFTMRHRPQHIPDGNIHLCLLSAVNADTGPSARAGCNYFPQINQINK